MKYFYGEAYYCDSAGKWRYAHDKSVVPGASTYVSPIGEVTMNAPELLAHQMLDTASLARLLNVETKSIATMLWRDGLPAAQCRRGNSPLWAVPIIEYWRKGRPGKGANLKKKAAA